jgi:hypothetical protein
MTSSIPLQQCIRRLVAATSLLSRLNEKQQHRAGRIRRRTLHSREQKPGRRALTLALWR